MNKSNFNWALIQSFLAAMEHGSLMGAARAVHILTPAATVRRVLNMTALAVAAQAGSR